MNSKLKNFIYSQNSINTYKSCPLKFKYKYIDNISWRYDDFSANEYYKGLKKGREFHLLCERYFSNIPLGEINDDKFNKWISKVKKVLPIKEVYTYLPEYEIRLSLNGNKILAKYDLVVIGENKIEIWDWKTESKEINYKNVENRMQTILYLVLAKEVIGNLLNINIPSENISMKYYQPEFDDGPICITYNDEKHKEYINKINQYITLIQKTNYKNEQEIYKNDRHCSYCEFNKLCNS